MQFADDWGVAQQNRRTEAAVHPHEQHIRPALAEEAFGEHGTSGVIADGGVDAEMLVDGCGQIEIAPSAHRGGSHYAAIDHTGGGHADADDLAVGHAEHLLDEFDDDVHGNICSGIQGDFGVAQRLSKQIGDRAVKQMLLRQINADYAQPVGVYAQQRASFALAAAGRLAGFAQ